MNSPKYITSLLAKQENIQPQKYNAQWMDAAISLELTKKTIERRKLVLSLIEKRFSTFSEEWTLEHTCSLVDALVIDKLWFLRKAYFHPMVDFSVFSPTKSPDQDQVVSRLGEEYFCTRVTVHSHLDDFCKKNDHIFPDYFSGFCKDLLKYMIKAAGSDYRISLIKPDTDVKFPSLGFKVICSKRDFDFTTTVLVITPDRATMNKERRL